MSVASKDLTIGNVPKLQPVEYFVKYVAAYGLHQDVAEIGRTTGGRWNADDSTHTSVSRPASTSRNVQANEQGDIDMNSNRVSTGWRSRVWWSLLLAVGTASTAAQADGPIRFKAHELTLGGSYSRVAAISDGTAVGSASIPGDAERHAFAWREDGGIFDLGTLGGTRAVASAVDGLHVVGTSLTAGDAEFHAFVWTPAAGMRDLGTLGGNYSEATSVSGGVVVGYSTVAAGDFHAFRWTRQTGMVDLGTLGNGVESAATRVERGLVTGWSTVVGNDFRTRRPVVWDPWGQVFDLVGTPFDIDPESGYVRDWGQALDVDRGVVVGYFHGVPAPDYRIHAFAWTVPHGFFDLGVPPGYTESFAYATNGELIVGQLSGGFMTHPFVWTRSGGFVDLGNLGNPNDVSFATAVNRNDWVVGLFTRPGIGGAGTFLWTRRTGMRDVTPALLPAGAWPVGIDDEGRIAVHDDQDELGTTRSAVLVPRRH
jgi:probable HAF family extracellular repeat protein